MYSCMYGFLYVFLYVCMYGPSLCSDYFAGRRLCILVRAANIRQAMITARCAAGDRGMLAKGCMCLT